MLIGSERQIEWANQIKADWLVSLENEYNNQMLRVNDGSMPKKWGDIVQEIYNKMKTNILSYTKATIFIDRKNLNAGQELESECIKKY